MRVSVTYHDHVNLDCLEIRVQVSNESVKKSRTSIPQLQPHETPTMFLVRLADWVATLPPHEQIQEEEGPPPTHDQLGIGPGHETLHLPEREPKD